MDLVTFAAAAGIPLVDVTVEAYEGRTGTGDTWATGVDARAYVEAKRKVVLSPEGSEVISETTVWLNLDVAAPPRSRVTHPGGVTRVITRSAFAAGGHPEIPEHAELACE